MHIDTCIHGFAERRFHHMGAVGSNMLMVSGESPISEYAVEKKWLLCFQLDMHMEMICLLYRGELRNLV